MMLGLGMQVVGWCCVALGALITAGNWWCVITTMRTHRFHSTVPLVAAAFVWVGLFLLPGVPRWAFSLVLADPGTTLFLAGLPRVVVGEVRGSRRS